MRTNLPVTSNEILLSDETLIVSKTDIKGRITYVNKDFLDISGYTEAELIGEPHNIVRHPEMPPEAFEDLWSTLKQERPWTGYVKNRAKNGDYYWVLANATPIWEGGQVAGYLSVRRKPSRDAVAAHETVYRQFKEKKQGNLIIRQGQAVTGSQWRENLSLAQRIGSILGLLGLLSIVIALVGIVALARTNDVTVSLYEHRFDGVRILGRITQLMSENRTQIALSGLGVHHDATITHADHSAYMQQVRQNVEEITRLWAEYQKTISAEDHRQMADAYAALRSRFVKEGLLPAVEAIEKGDNGTAWALFQEKVNPLYIEAVSKANDLRDRHVRLGKSEMTESQERYAMTRNTQIGLLLILLATGFVLTIWLIRAIRTDLRSVIEVLRNIAQGQYSNAIDITRDNEVGKLLQGLQSMQTRMGFEVSETKRRADDMSRIKIGLYSSSAAITISDANGLLMHATPIAEDLLRSVCGKNLTDLVGKRLVDTVLTDPKVQSDMNDAVLRGHTIDIKLGNHHLRLAARPIKSEHGTTLGRVTTWIDRTAEVAIENEVADIVSAAAMGNLSKRIDITGKEGFFASLGEGLNKFLSVTQQALETTSEVLSRVAGGDLSRIVEAEFSGVFGKLKDDTNQTIERLRDVVGQIKEASDTINTAAKEIAAGNQDLSSRTEEQASSLEETASSMEQLNATVKQNAESARQANELAGTSNEIATRGGQMVKQVVHTMTGIQTSSQKIADIVGVIDSIAFQTNILALNAAVEAARAGEQGRGFAVVASEVRNLAQRSAKAAKEIKLLIAESVDKVESGAQLVNEAGSTMDEVVSSFQQVARLVMDITNASREQSSGIEQVTQAVSQMDEVTQQNAALVEEAAAAAESLEEQAQGLVQAVGMFKLNEGHGATNLPGPVLRDATPRQLSNANAAASRPAAKPKHIAPLHLANDDEEWAKF